MNGPGWIQNLPDPDVMDSVAGQLLDFVRSLGTVAVAFSGGVDSAVVASAAFRSLNNDAIAVIADSPSLPRLELNNARKTADHIGIKLVEIKTDELEDENYQANNGTRCFYCKSRLYQAMIAQKPQFGFQTMINGTNLDDLSEFRPGLRAAEKYNVRSPLAECGLDKTTVRRLAAFWQLPVWDKPASPCLSSRIAYRNRVTPAKLAKIERAEVILERYGFANCRARLHTDDILRIEVSVDQIAVLSEDRMRRRLLSEMDSLGFSFITLDLQGFHSGSLNQLIDLQSSLLTDAKPKPSS